VSERGGGGKNTRITYEFVLPQGREFPQRRPVTSGRRGTRFYSLHAPAAKLLKDPRVAEGSRSSDGGRVRFHLTGAVARLHDFDGTSDHLRRRGSVLKKVLGRSARTASRRRRLGAGPNPRPRFQTRRARPGDGAFERLLAQVPRREAARASRRYARRDARQPPAQEEGCRRRLVYLLSRNHRRRRQASAGLRTAATASRPAWFFRPASSGV